VTEQNSDIEALLSEFFQTDVLEEFGGIFHFFSQGRFFKQQRVNKSMQTRFPPPVCFAIEVQNFATNALQTHLLLSAYAIM
jgi:hypothetical protein